MQAVDVVVVGAGTAGLSAGYVTASKGYKTLILGSLKESNLTIKKKVKNYPGVDPKTSGPSILENAKANAVKVGALFSEAYLTSMINNTTSYTLTTANGETITAKLVIIATGDNPRTLDVPGATLKAAPSPKSIAVVGSGDDAVKKALKAAKNSEKVYLLVRGSELKTTQEKKQKLAQNPRIEIIYNKVLKEIVGSQEVSAVAFEDGTSLSCDAVVCAIGRRANTALFSKCVVINEAGYIKTLPDSHATTSPGIFAAGACIDKAFGHKQAAISTGEGMKAGYEAVGYLKSLK